MVPSHGFRTHAHNPSQTIAPAAYSYSSNTNNMNPSHHYYDHRTGGEGEERFTIPSNSQFNASSLMGVNNYDRRDYAGPSSHRAFVEVHHHQQQPRLQSQSQSYYPSNGAYGNDNRYYEAENYRRDFR